MGIRARSRNAKGGAGGQEGIEQIAVSLWPNDFVDFLQRRVGRAFVVKAYILDPARCQEPVHGTAKPQELPSDATALDDDPFKGLIKINEISAQRGFGHETEAGLDEDDSGGIPGRSGTRKLSEQLRRYYNRHLDPNDNAGAPPPGLGPIRIPNSAVPSSMASLQPEIARTQVTSVHVRLAI